MHYKTPYDFQEDIMKIAYFTDTFLPQVNGVTNTLGKLDAYLERNSIQHMFFAPQYPEAYQFEDPSKVKRFKSISLPIYNECRLSIPSYASLSKTMNEFNPDLIHLVTSFGIGWMGLKYAREKGMPIVSSFHTNFDSYLKYYKLEYLEEPIWNYFRWFHNFCEINFCPSTDTMKELDDKGFKNTRIWSRGIDIEKFNPVFKNTSIREKFDALDKMIFLYVGRVAAEKDLDILLECMNEINALHPGKACFIITGDGPYAGHMKKNSPANTHFTGYLKGVELAEIYASSDVFAFPSSTETFGNVVLEAMASGLPVIAANEGGVTDSIRHGFNGFLCEARNALDFTKAMERFINNPYLIESMGAAAREHILNKSWDNIFDGLMGDYQEIISKVQPGYGKIA
jgi:glycosyltransferase involved in cell wall biosynthesis